MSPSSSFGTPTKTDRDVELPGEVDPLVVGRHVEYEDGVDRPLVATRRMPAEASSSVSRSTS